jgi:cell division protein ZapA (FtsZ GTPase activity inhibitor)
MREKKPRLLVILREMSAPTVSGGVEHNLPQEAPQALTKRLWTLMAVNVSDEMLIFDGFLRKPERSIVCTT